VLQCVAVFDEVINGVFIFGGRQINSRDVDGTRRLGPGRQEESWRKPSGG